MLAMMLIIMLQRLPSSEPPPLMISQLTESTYVYTTCIEFNGNLFPSNSMYVVTDSGVVMFDTPWDTTQMQALFDSIEVRHHKPVILCIATHFHDDRTAGFPYLQRKGIPTYSSAYTRTLCLQRGMPAAGFIFSEDTVFIAGGTRIETFYPGKGHSPDNIVLWMPSNRLLYGGCFIKSTVNDSPGNLEDADVNVWIQSLEKLKNKYPKPEFVIPGHFNWGSNKAVRHTLKLLQKHLSGAGR